MRLGGDWDLVTRVAVWGVGFGVLGARLYHDVTSWSEVPTPKWQGMCEVWKGGLGIWGGILFGALAGAVVIRRAGASVPAFLDAAAPGLLLAQGIGRIGNWWNQELYGKPTKLPWGLEIDARPPAGRPYFNNATFHPTFLYELIWDLIGVAAPALDRAPVHAPAAGPLRAVRRLVLLRPLLRGAPARSTRRTTSPGLRLNAWVSVDPLRRVRSSTSSGTSGARPAEACGEPRRAAAPKGPAMAIPKGVASGSASTLPRMRRRRP